MKKTLMVLAILLFIGLSAGALKAENFVSFNGGFFIVLPENWYQVDYKTVDFYLFSGQADEESFKYEGVFADRENVPFHNGAYLILTLELVGDQSNKQVDSVLKDLDSIFNDGKKYFPAGDLSTDLNADVPYYNRDKRTISVMTEITGDDSTVKKNVWVKKFYDKGIANFYFYSPDSTFQTNKALFNDILNTFQTENIETAAPKEKLELAKIRNEKNSADNVEKSIPYAVLVVIIIVIIIGIKKKKR
ncbi:MAG: hypothetical protein ACOYVF_12440 [Candidatus Zixiibacteriota bacterium]